MGKTNLLDAIYYLCMGKSYFGIRDRYLVQHGGDFFRLEGDFILADSRTDKVVAKVVPQQRKELERNGRVYDRIADHVGRFPVVIIVPDDTLLITEGSTERRRFVDNTLSQLDPRYLESLLIYNRILKQRNALLKQAAGRKLSDTLLLAYDEQLIAPAAYIYEQRTNFMSDFTVQFQHAYQGISNGAEAVGIRYRSALEQMSLTEILRENREKDRLLERTSQGIHRDDLVFTLEGHPLKRIASQGQRKSFVLALKLAQYQFLRQQKGLSPVLLLDDIFDKLDPQRVKQLIDYIISDEYGQIFLTDTDPNRVDKLLEMLTVQVMAYHIDGGTAELKDLKEEE